MAKFLVKTPTTERSSDSEQEILEWFLAGTCHPGNFVYLDEQKTWITLAELPTIAAYFSDKPTAVLEKCAVHVMHAGREPRHSGPYSLSQLKERFASGEFCGQSWIFVDGDKEWRQVMNVKILKDLLPALPVSEPAPSVQQPTRQPTGSVPRPVESGEYEDRDEVTNAVSVLGLDMKVASPPAPALVLDLAPAAPALELAPPLEVAPAPIPAPTPVPTPSPPPPTPAQVKVPPPPTFQPAPKVAIAADSKLDRDQGSYDGITAEIPADPIWLIKKNESENVMGPFRFLEVMKFLQEGKISKNDKISKLGSNRYCKILQQYEFNVQYTLETVVEGGVEKQKILIRRRHPRVPYMADIQVTRGGAMTLATCVNISAGGVLAEASKVDFALGEMVEIKILPGLINRTIVCKALVIGKIPKMPPGFAFKFEELKREDKEAIEYFVQAGLKKETLRV